MALSGLHLAEGGSGLCIVLPKMLALPEKVLVLLFCRFL